MCMFTISDALIRKRIFPFTTLSSAQRTSRIIRVIFLAIFLINSTLRHDCMAFFLI